MDAEAVYGAVYDEAMAVFISALAADIKAVAVCKKTREDLERARADCDAAWVVVEEAREVKRKLVRPPGLAVKERYHASHNL